MTETVTDIIVARSRAEDRLAKAVAWSIGLHALVVAVAVLLPAPKADTPPTVMTISLGGSAGVRSEGMTEAAGGTVQEKAPADVKPVETAPAPKRPEMTLPDPKKVTRPQARPNTAPQQATGRAPSQGETPTEGTAPSRVRGQGFGMTTSGGNGTGGVRLDVGDFCCQEYLEQMVAAIRLRWNQQQPVKGTTAMKFTIQKDGTITDIQVERSSGFAVLDNEARHALQVTQRLAPLPGKYPNPTLGVHLLFDYY
jgi:TonB family protein